MPERTLAIDPGRLTGWSHTLHSGGTVELFRPGAPMGERFAKFSDWLSMTLADLPTDRIVCEAQHHRGGAATRQQLGIIAEIERLAYCHELKVDYAHTATLKKHATGSGRSDKDAMKRAAMKQNPTIEVGDDNHVDALWLLHWSAGN